MDLQPLALVFCLLAVNAQAGEYDPPGYEPASGSTEWRLEQGMSAFPEPVDYGTRTDVYLMGDGEVDVRRSDAAGESDEFNVLDYDYD